MCIILYHPSGAKLPEKETMVNCFEKNDDGCGFMMERDGLRIRKGFMTFESFWAAYTNERFTEEDAFGVHFRWATSGDVIAGNTHPFPIVDNLTKLQKLKIKPNEGFKIALMHNGVLSKGRGELSDTMTFIIDTLFPIVTHLEDEKVVDAIGSLMTDKLLFYVNGQFFRTGSWVNDKTTGCFYSNTQYKVKVFSTYKGNMQGARSDGSSDYGWLEHWNGGAFKAYTCPTCKIYGTGFVSGRWHKNVTCSSCGCFFDPVSRAIYKSYDSVLWRGSDMEDIDELERVDDEVGWSCDECGYIDSTYCKLCKEDWAEEEERKRLSKEMESAREGLKCYKCHADGEYLDFDTAVDRWFCICCDLYV